MFFGKSYWPIKYGLVLKDGASGGARGDYLELCKAFKQFHMISGFSELIDNGIVASGRSIVTNCAALYNRAGDSSVSEVMKADISIKRELQRTEIIDTASVHDLKLIPNAFYIEEALGWLFNNNTGKIRAEQMAIAHVRDKMRDMYQGHVLIRGFGAVRPHDCFYLDDPYNKIHGMVDVGRVVIHMGFDTGFVTSIKPDLCVAEVDDKTNLAYARLLAHGVAIGFAMARWVAVFHASGLLTKSSYARGARTIAPYARTALKGVLKFSGQMLTLKVGDGLHGHDRPEIGCPGR